MIGQQAVRVHRTVVPLGKPPQLREVYETLVVRQKAGGAVVATLDDMKSYTIHGKAQGPRHVCKNDNPRRALTKSGSDPDLVLARVNVVSARALHAEECVNPSL